MFELVVLREGVRTLRDLETGETFHPVVGPMAEAEAIHIGPLRLEARLLQEQEEGVTIWDVGLGAAANAVALLEKLTTLDFPFACRLVSFDRTLEPLRFAIEHAAELGYPQRWKTPLSHLAETKTTRIQFAPGGALEWQLCLEDFTRLPAAPAPDGVIYDPYSPAKNPAMWSLRHFSALRARLTRAAVLTSYSRSTAVRVTLLLAGFYAGVGGATGEKDQTTIAATDLALLAHPLPRQWLERVRKSTSARPLGGGSGDGAGGPGPISAEDLRALEGHPQFA